MLDKKLTGSRIVTTRGRNRIPDQGEKGIVKHDFSSLREQRDLVRKSLVGIPRAMSAGTQCASTFL